MRVPSVQFVAVAVFSLGFVLTSSGLSGVVRALLDDRPAWSVCGEGMCSCVPTDGGLDCPLCALGGAGLMDLGSCTADEACETEPPVRRVPKTDETMRAVDGAVSSSASMLFLTLVVWRGRGGVLVPGAGGRWVVARVRDPGTRGIGVPTPPPRG